MHPYSRGPLPGSPYKFLYIFENRVVGLEEVAGRTGRTGEKGGYLLLVHARGVLGWWESQRSPTGIFFI